MANSSSQLDLLVILWVPASQFAPWLAVVLLVTWAGYPGVVCVTPMAWLIALRVGLICVSQSSSLGRARRLLEAVLAGAVFGLLQGLLFWVLTPRMGPVLPSEQAGMNVIIGFMILVGMLAGAMLSLFTAYLVERRRITED
jgi:hypothetical protein